MITRWRGTASPYNKLRFFFLALRYAQRLLCDAGSGVRSELPKIWRIMGSKGLGSIFHGDSTSGLVMQLSDVCALISKVFWVTWLVSLFPVVP